MSSSSVFANLLATYPTWVALRDFLRSEEGGKISVYEVSDSSLATLRYMKGESNLSLEHVGAFRSVVWNTETNRPVSVTPFKSQKGEELPAGDLHDAAVEEFVDGVLIGQFWDASTESWRIHTRTMLDANCRYFSKTKSFATMFDEAVVAVFGAQDAVMTDDVPRDLCFSWILSHPENRIVCPVYKPRITLVATYRVDPTTGSVTEVPPPPVFAGKGPRRYYNTSDNQSVMSYAQAAAMVSSGDLNTTLVQIVQTTTTLQSQGFVVKIAGNRWKIRSPTYNMVRHLRGNSPRLEFMWLDYWSKGSLNTYLQHYPEERLQSQAVIDRWMSVSKDVFKWYSDVFKARTVGSDQIPRKYRPLVYGLHDLYRTLREQGKSLDWRAAMGWLNERDTAQKLFVINWDLRQERSANLLVAEV